LPNELRFISQAFEIIYQSKKNDIKGGIANRDFTLEGREYKRGTAVFFIAGSEDIHNHVRRASEKYGVTLYGVNTGYSDDGIDLGSGRPVKVKPVHIRSIKEAMVTVGGVSLAEINPQTMQSQKCPGLYFAGEVMDVDGPTGGYNLSAAFATARLAVKALAGV